MISILCASLRSRVGVSHLRVSQHKRLSARLGAFSVCRVESKDRALLPQKVYMKMLSRLCSDGADAAAELGLS